MDIQLKKGVLEYCLLHQISKKERYGYDLLKQVADAFPSVQESTIYAILRRLRTNQLAETYEGKISEGPVRKYYRITEQGRIALLQMKQDWEDLVYAVERMCGEGREKE
ncbi:MAG: PadR family transcriptional regulator [Clostridiales bacterium]|jgi:PadR family transcriptional regulator PadR|nr:PadR family transcriptional regulator [Clostridiales bacterium]